MRSKTMGTKKRKRKPSIEADTSDLPCDVVYNILSRLPAKSLLRFRCVSKPWRKVIFDPQFAEHHLSQSTRNLNREKLFVLAYNSDFFYSINCGTCDSSSERLYFPVKKYRNSDILGSCNGLILLRHHRENMFVLWNPSTRSYIKFSCSTSEDPYYSLTGLCYDSNANDYKAVFINQSGFSYSGAVFSCKSNSWKVIDESPYIDNHRTRRDRCGVNVNGALHWVVGVERGGYKSNLIVYFDLLEEKFKEVPQPEGLQNNRFRVSIMGGCLCLYYVSKNRVTVWTMKEYGVKRSWTVLNIDFPMFVKYAESFCFTLRGKVVAVMGLGPLFMYNLEDNKRMNEMSLTIAGGFPAITFVDSLVLPTRGNKTTRQRGRYKKA